MNPLTAPQRAGEALPVSEQGHPSAPINGKSRHLQPPEAKKAATDAELRLLERLLRAAGCPPLDVTFWDGRGLQIGEPPRMAVTIGSRSAFWKIMADPMFQFGEAYSDGSLHVEGDLTEFMILLFRALARQRKGHNFVLGLSRWLRPRRGRSLSRAKEYIYHHYDIGNAFYELWLDARMVYTCAYFAQPDWSLEQAQAAKLDHVCRKVQVRPNDRVIEAGCGWGALAMHAARHYGAKVRAFNISHEQIEFARWRARQDGLAANVEFIEDDWRNISGPCDVFLSVGMLEHVGKPNYKLLGQTIDKCLTSAGRGLIHSIGQNFPQPFGPWIERRIFPGAYAPSLREMMDIFEDSNFAVLDVENLRLHYAETLRHWLSRFEDSREKVLEMFDERFVRMWRLYLAGSLANFYVGALQLFQVVFTRSANNDIPWSRRHLYETNSSG